MALTTPQTIECFHLGFLGVLRTRLDAGRYVLKGGANLRYFFGSVRYSEDIDLDINGVEGWKLEDQIDKTLSSNTLTIVLRAAGVQVLADQITKPMQTNTTRRWKVPIAADGLRTPVRTKIEFSARNGEERYALETVPDAVTRAYAMRPPSLQHYLLGPATEQKVMALALRPETQARDVFDLDLLLRKAPLEQDRVSGERRRAAAECAISLPYAAFEGQVRPFLDPAVASTYDQPTWEQIQDFVAGELLS